MLSSGLGCQVLGYILGLVVRCSLLLGLVRLVFVGVNWKQFSIISANC